MSKITFTDKVDGINNPAPAINKVIASDLNSIKASTNVLYDGQGWIRYQDTVNTSANKQALPEDIQTQITIVDLTPIDTYKTVIIGTDNLWTGNKITPHLEGDCYMVRLDFTASIDNLTGFFQLTVDIDGLIGSVYDTTQTFPRGANVAHKFSFTFLIYTLDTFITNGGEVLITPSDPMLIWDKSILINRIYGAETIA